MRNYASNYTFNYTHTLIGGHLPFFQQKYIFSNSDSTARGTIKTPGSISLLEMSTGVTDLCKFIVSIGVGAIADSSIVLFS